VRCGDHDKRGHTSHKRWLRAASSASSRPRPWRRECWRANGYGDDEQSESLFSPPFQQFGMAPSDAIGQTRATTSSLCCFRFPWLNGPVNLLCNLCHVPTDTRKRFCLIMPHQHDHLHIILLLDNMFLDVFHQSLGSMDPSHMQLNYGMLLTDSNGSSSKTQT
jgi:hypothetical protein